MNLFSILYIALSYALRIFNSDKSDFMWMAKSALIEWIPKQFLGCWWRSPVTYSVNQHL